MVKNNYYLVTGIIFFIITILQLMRIINQWPAQIGNFVIPIWASGITVVITLLLGIWAFKLLAHYKR